MGTSEFAIPSLEQLIAGNFEIVGVVTQPDRPSGRGKRLAPPPVKIIAAAHNLPIYQPEKVRRRDFIRVLKKLQPTAIVVAAFGQLLPKSVLAIPPCGCINTHPSLLPKYRGAAPIQWALINGETETGVTIMLLDEGADTGDIILQKRVKIDPQDTASTLSNRLAHLAAPLLIQALQSASGVPPPHSPQNHADATPAPRLTKEIGAIDWGKSADEICNLVRGTADWPSAYTYFGDNLRLKIIDCTAVDSTNLSDYPPGTIQITHEKELIVLAGQRAVRLDCVQPANRHKISGYDFINGHRLRTGDRFFGKDQPSE